MMDCKLPEGKSYVLCPIRNDDCTYVYSPICLTCLCHLTLFSILTHVSLSYLERKDATSHQLNITKWLDSVPCSCHLESLIFCQETPHFHFALAPHQLFHWFWSYWGQSLLPSSVKLLILPTSQVFSSGLHLSYLPSSFISGVFSPPLPKIWSSCPTATLQKLLLINSLKKFLFPNSRWYVGIGIFIID